MYSGSARKNSRHMPLFNGTNYIQSVYQSGRGLEIPSFINKEENTDSIVYFNNQINLLKAENLNLLNLITANTNKISENSSNINMNADNLEILEAYLYSHG